jgi:hypothetical protein
VFADRIFCGNTSTPLMIKPQVEVMVATFDWSRITSSESYAKYNGLPLPELLVKPNNSKNAIITLAKLKTLFVILKKSFLY